MEKEKITKKTEKIKIAETQRGCEFKNRSKTWVADAKRISSSMATNLEIMRSTAIATFRKNTGKCAKRGARPRRRSLRNSKKQEIFEFWRVAKSKFLKEKSYNNKRPATGCRHETMVLSTWHAACIVNYKRFSSVQGTPTPTIIII